MLKNCSISLMLLLFMTSIFAQTTAIPDPVFEQVLIDSTIDSDGVVNGTVATADISGIRFLTITNKGITDLTGIQDFSSLEELNCNVNGLTSLDLSQNMALTKISCAINQLTSLNLGQNTVLTEVICSDNQLMSLDVSQNTALTRLFCYKNQIGSLNVSQNTLLTHLSAFFNPLTNLDVSQNTALSVLNCGYGPINSLDVTKNLALTELSCTSGEISDLDISQNTMLLELGVGGNKLKSLDLSQNTSLESFSCDRNQLSSLDLSQHTSLEFVDCSLNQLTNLNLKNGNNNTLIFVKATNNPLLECIQVGNEIDANAGLGDYSIWLKDATSIYSENCPTVLGVEDQLLAESLHVFPNPSTHNLTIDSKIDLKNIEFYTVLGQKVMTVQSGFNEISINKLSRGIYVLRIFSENGTAIRKLIKE